MLDDFRRAPVRSLIEPLESRIAPAFAASISPGQLDGDNGFTVTGEQGDFSGASVSDAGDVNGDGIDDFIIGAPTELNGPGGPGRAYVVFGRAAPPEVIFNVSALDGTNGFRINGIDPYDRSGVSVSAAGDFNGDGFDDVMIGAAGAGSGGTVASGETYIIFGKATSFPATGVDLSSLDGYNGFVIDGLSTGDYSGRSVGNAGDLNGDGFDDVIIGAPLADERGQVDTGGAYVVFGAQGPFSRLNVDSLNGQNGFRLAGSAVGDYTGASVSGAGDFNGDGFADVIVGAPNADANGNTDGGVSYVVFGAAGGFPAVINLADLNGVNGFKLTGAQYDFSGSAVGGAGDINGDGLADLIVGAPFSGEEEVSAGAAYVVFGQSSRLVSDVNLLALDGTSGFQIAGGDEGGAFGGAVSGASDVNGDGFADLIVGSPYGGESTDRQRGAAYVIFGASSFSPTFNLAKLNGRNGFVIKGAENDDLAGASVSSAGDINGDGVADLIVGAPGAEVDGTSLLSGATYLIFGIATQSVVTFTEADGDKVTVSINKGGLTLGDLELIPSGSGFILGEIDLSGREALMNATLSITAEPQESFLGGPRLGDGKVNVGKIEAGGLNLKKVKITGNLGFMRAGLVGQIGKLAVKKMEVDSLGVAASPLLGANDSGLSMNGGIGKLKVLGDVLNFAASIGAGQGGGLKKMTVGGSMLGSSFDVGENFGALRLRGDMTNTSFSVGSDFQKVTVDQEVNGTSFVVGGALQTATFKGGLKNTSFKTTEAVGTVIVAGDVEASLVRAGTFLRNFVVGGSVIDSTVSAPGKLLPENTNDAQAFRIIGVRGDVVRSQILAGYGQDGLPINGDAGLGRIVIGGNFEASSIVAGATAGADGLFGNDDDALIAGGNDVVAKIASITIRGMGLGTAAGADHFGIVAEEIGKLKIDGERAPLTSGPANDLGGIALGAADDLRAREVG